MQNWFLHYNFCKASWDLQLSGTLTVVESTSSCPEYLQLSKAPTVVQSIYNYQKSLQLSGLPTAVESIFSCREHLQLSKVPPAVESTSTCPTYLQLSRTPPVVECTSNGPKYLQLSRASPVVDNTYSCREHFQLSKVPSVLQSDFCQTGSVIENDSTALARLVHTEYRVINSLCNWRKLVDSRIAKNLIAFRRKLDMIQISLLETLSQVKTRECYLPDH